MADKSDERVYWKADTIYGAIFDYRISLMYGADSEEYRETTERNKRSKYRQLMNDLEAKENMDIKGRANQVYSYVRLEDSQVLLQTAILLFLNGKHGCTAKDIQMGLGEISDEAREKELRRLGVSEEQIEAETKIENYVVKNKQLRNALKSLVSSGMVCVQNEKRPEIYRLNEDIFEDINHERVSCVLDFAGKALPFSGLIHSLSRVYAVTHKDYSEKTQKDNKESLSFEHASANQILDEYVLWVMMTAYSENHTVAMNYYNSDTKKYQPKICIPLRCVYDILHNRVYFVAYDCDSQRVSIFRADRILKPTIDTSLNVEEIRNTEAFRVEKKKAFRCIERSWMVSMSQELEKVELCFPNKPYIRRRVENECHNATLSYTEDTIVLQVTVNEPKEMLPWIRTFGTDCTIVKPRSLAKREIEKMHEMMEFYEYEL